MEKEFDFNSVGKRLPYALKEEELKEITTNTLLKIHQRKRSRLLKSVIGVAASLLVVCCATAIYHSIKSTVTVEEVISNMSDSDLEALVSLSDSDILFNEEF